MSCRIVKICISLLAATALTGEVAAQSKSLGSLWSFSGIGISYEHRTDNDTFAEISLKAEMGEVYFGRANIPGCSAAFTWNIVFKSWQSKNGNRIDLFGGPGAIAGWANDYFEDTGVFFGMKGRIGVECTFSRKITISACLSPIIGSHAMLLDESVKMHFYRYGLMNALFPEIGIRYSFR